MRANPVLHSHRLLIGRQGDDILLECITCRRAWLIRQATLDRIISLYHRPGADTAQARDVALSGANGGTQV